MRGCLSGCVGVGEVIIQGPQVGERYEKGINTICDFGVLVP